MCIFKCFSHFYDLTVALRRTEIDSSANRYSTHFPCILDRTEHDLIEVIRVRKEFVVVDLNDKRNFMCILTGNRTQYTICRSNSVTTAFDSQFHDVFRIKIDWVWCERCTSAMLNTLIHRQDRYISGIGQAAVT
ncbi:hypothetical protein D3C86_1751590 [compost metagenome]